MMCEQTCRLFLPGPVQAVHDALSSLGLDAPLDDITLVGEGDAWRVSVNRTRISEASALRGLDNHLALSLQPWVRGIRSAMAAMPPGHLRFVFEKSAMTAAAEMAEADGSSALSRVAIDILLKGATAAAELGFRDGSLSASLYLDCAGRDSRMLLWHNEPTTLLENERGSELLGRFVEDAGSWLSGLRAAHLVLNGPMPTAHRRLDLARQRSA